MAQVERRTFYREFSTALREGDAALFVGAGVSRAAGYVDWKELLAEIADDLHLDVNKEGDLVAVAQYHVNERGGRDRINKLLIDEFLEDVELTENHKLIASLPIDTIWTTNYDDLIERAFEAQSRRVDVKRKQDDFAVNRRRSDVTIYKMHGDRHSPAEAVLTKEDYETYNEKRSLYTIALKGDLARRTFLFVGFSFTDPNIMYVLGRVKQLLEQNGRKHFCLLKAPKSDDGIHSDYDVNRFRHWLADLGRYNIQPILFDEYAEVPAILAELNRRSHLRSVFISGSAVEFEPMGEQKFQLLCQTLGSDLVANQFNVVSGYGVGVGDRVIVGAMQALRRNDDERLQLWPFPQTLPPDTDRKAYWRQYRERMLSGAGVCLVLAGNKLVEGKVVLADGVREEVAIARARGLAVIPIGATGSVAHELWMEAVADPSTSFGDLDVKSELEILGDSARTVPELVKAVVSLLKKLNL